MAVVLSFFHVKAETKQDIVYVIPIENEVEKGLHAFLKRGLDTAEENGASLVVFDINTPGGAVDAAGDIAKLLQTANVKTVAFVNNKALSAGAYIALNTDEIYMVPNASMGAAAVIDSQGNTAGKKAESYWQAAMESAAKQNNRDPKYAIDMADKDNPITLTPEKAVKVGYAEGIVKNQKELLKKLGYDQADVRSIKESFAEKLARFLTNPIVVPILLSVASLGLVVELYSPGFGVPGTMGLTALILFFYGHLVAGLAGYESVILFIIGLGLLIAELFLPGAIAGILGIAAIISSFLMAGGNIVQMSISILIAMAVTVIGMILMVKVFGKRMKLFNKLILSDSTNTENGYVSNINRTDLINQIGTTLAPLRPSGTIEINSERLDVVSEGEFIQKDVKVQVIKVEGSRIVVRPIK